MAERILEEVEAWITQHDRIQFAFPVNGGWERWAQIDFSTYMNAAPRNIPTNLEDACFLGNDQRADLTVGPQGGNIPGAVMELKVLNSNDSLAAYKAKLVSDQTKLNQQLKPTHAGFMKCSYGIASSTMLIPLLQAAYPGQIINVATFQKFLQLSIPSHHIENATSVSGEVFAMSFIYV
jgi:hypothetical protein